MNKYEEILFTFYNRVWGINQINDCGMYAEGEMAKDLDKILQETRQEITAIETEREKFKRRGIE